MEKDGLFSLEMSLNASAFKAGGTGEPAAPYPARFLGALPPDLPALFPSEDTGSPACSMPCGGQEAGPPVEPRSLVEPFRENNETQVRRGVRYHGALKVLVSHLCLPKHTKLKCFFLFSMGYDRKQVTFDE